VTVNVALSAAATLVALAFAISTFDRWLRRRRSHDGAWTISLAFFTVASAALWWAQSSGWDLPTFRVFFLFGAILNVPWLALGTVYLLFGSRIGDRIRMWLIGLSGAATGVVLSAPTQTGAFSTSYMATSNITTSSFVAESLPKGSEIFGVAPRVFAAVGSGVAAVIIIAGALWSMIRLLRGRAPAIGLHQRQIGHARRSAGGNALIALGTIVLSASGSLAARLGEERAFIVTLVIGVIILFSGFLVASSSQRAPQQLAEKVMGQVVHD
jgi:hypothetical protein